MGEPLAALRVIHPQEVIQKVADVVAPLPQGRDLDVDEVQAVEEVLPEVARLDLLDDILVGGGDHLDIEGHQLGAADGDQLPLLQDAQEFCLHIQRHVGDLVQEENALVRQLEFPLFAAPPRAGIGALLIAEELALQQAPGQGTAVHRDKGAVAPGALVVDGLGEHLLAGAAVALDDDPGLKGGGLLGQLLGDLHALGVPLDVIQEEGAFGVRPGELDGPALDVGGHGKGPDLVRAGLAAVADLVLVEEGLPGAVGIPAAEDADPSVPAEPAAAVVHPDQALNGGGGLQGGDALPHGVLRRQAEDIHEFPVAVGDPVVRAHVHHAVGDSVQDVALLLVLPLQQALAAEPAEVILNGLLDGRHELQDVVAHPLRGGVDPHDPDELTGETEDGRGIVRVAVEPLQVMLRASHADRMPQLRDQGEAVGPDGLFREILDLADLFQAGRKAGELALHPRQLPSDDIRDDPVEGAAADGPHDLLQDAAAVGPEKADALALRAEGGRHVRLEADVHLPAAPPGFQNGLRDDIRAGGPLLHVADPGILIAHELRVVDVVERIVAHSLTPHSLQKSGIRHDGLRERSPFRREHVRSEACFHRADFIISYFSLRGKPNAPGRRGEAGCY